MYEDFNEDKNQKANRGFNLALLSICLFGGALWLGCFLTSTLDAVIASILLFIPAIILLCKSDRREMYSVSCLILNSLANGMVAAVYYLKIQFVPVLFDFKALILPLIILLLAYLLFVRLKRGRQWVNLFMLLLQMALIVGSIVGWIRTGAVIHSISLFGLVFSMIYSIVFAVSFHRCSRSVNRAMAVGSFGILCIVVVIVILLITDGEAMDGVFEGLGELIVDALPSRKKSKP